jgi:hypothetical protein
MSRGVRFSLRSVDALCAFQALTRHSSLDEGIFTEKSRKQRNTSGTAENSEGGGNG